MRPRPSSANVSPKSFEFSPADTTKARPRIAVNMPSVTMIGEKRR
jgi:hypothetical protein